MLDIGYYCNLFFVSKNVNRGACLWWKISDFLLGGGWKKYTKLVFCKVHTFWSKDCGTPSLISSLRPWLWRLIRVLSWRCSRIPHWLRPSVSIEAKRSSSSHHFLVWVSPSNVQQQNNRYSVQTNKQTNRVILLW